MQDILKYHVTSMDRSDKNPTTYFLYLMVFVTAILHASTQPLECTNYMELSNAERRSDFPSTYSVTDRDLTPGWYRITGAAGTHLKEGVPFGSQGVTFFGEEDAFCGFKSGFGFLYVLRNNSHPTVDEGIARVKLFVYRYSRSFFPAQVVFFQLITDGPDIIIRNCDGYFVYYLRGFTGRYCTDDSGADKDTSATPWECESTEQTILDQPDRVWDHLPDFKDNLANDGFESIGHEKSFRFQIDGVEHRLAENCPSPGSASKRPCNTYYRSWLVGKHPKVSDGRQQKEICFSPPGSCKCVWSIVLHVRNCGSHFAYIHLKEPRFDVVWRYCTVESSPNPASTNPPPNDNLCLNYKVINGEERLYDHIDPNTATCEAKYLHSVRFLTKRGAPLKMRDSCNDTTDLFVYRGRCGGSNGESFMLGGHPSVEDGAVFRTVCRRVKSIVDHSSCGNCGLLAGSDAEQEVIRVQNCGSFFVYELEPLHTCETRYCLQRQAFVPMTTPTTTTDTIPCPDLCPARGAGFSGLIVDPSNPYRFISCDFGTTRGCQTCPGGLVFNEAIQVCDYPPFGR